jgi:TPR repeat/Tetratricopeptide repeat
VRRRTSWIFISSLAALVAVVALAATAAVPPNVAKTIEAQRHLAAERPQDAAVFNDLANLLLLAGQTAEAESTYRQAIELDPNKATALFNLGLLLQQRGELREAAELYDRVLKLEPRHAWAHYQAGTIYERWGQKSRAVDSYAAAFAIDPQLAFPEVNPHIVENQLVTEAMLRAYRNDNTQPQAPRLYDDPARIATLLVPRPAPTQEEKDEMADKAAPQRGPQAPAAAGRQPGAAAGHPPGQPQGPGATVLRERDLDRGNPAGQALPQGSTNRGAPGYNQQQQGRGLREWSRPEPTIQEVPEGVDNGYDDGAQPAPVITPPPGGVYYRPGVQSSARMSLRIAPPQQRAGRPTR